MGQGLLGGIVLDDEEGSSLPGAHVSIEGTPLVTVTDIDGQFVLTGVPAGPQVLVVSYLSFADSRVDLTVVDGENETIEVRMFPDVVLGQEVLVTAQALGQAKAINQQLNAESIVNIVSADRIQELPDVNAAEAIARLPGVAINRSGGEGQKVVIRGMEPKFAAIAVNGIRLPANSSTDRSVDLSLISPEMLEGIELFKSPTPDMDAESVGGTVNLKLRKAPKGINVLAKLLGGYNDINSTFSDYKAVLQGSNRFLDNKLGIVLQGSIERFNRGGDFYSKSWSQGETNPETGVTSILGSALTLQDRQEDRRRTNASVNLDYDLGGKHSLSFFGIYSGTTRDQLRQEERYNPGGPDIRYTATQVDNSLDLITMSLTGEHPIGKFIVDWSLGTSETRGKTPRDFSVNFTTADSPFDATIDRFGDPDSFYDLATPDFDITLLNGNELDVSSTTESTRTALVNLNIPLKLGDKIGGYFKFGGKYFTIERDRKLDRFTENFYYLGGNFTKSAIAAYTGNVTALPANGALISVNTFLQPGLLDYEPGGAGEGRQLFANFDQDIIKQWGDEQRSLLSANRGAIVDNYSVSERLTAGYAMLKLNFNDVLTVIPGFRIEASDNQYNAVISSISGRYGVNGFSNDTTTFQTYTEFLPHLHIKFQPLDWFDVRASYTNTLARPDFNFITPRAQINNTAASLRAGNPNLSHMTSENIDVFVSAYKGGLGLLSFGVFQKNIDNIFYPWTIALADQALADANGWPNHPGFLLSSYTNAGPTTVRGFEIDLQTGLGFLPKPFNGLVLNANYSRLYSETEIFFLTSESVLVIPFPPVFETIFTTNKRLVSMPSQAPHIFHLSVGYDLNRFSARVSGVFQGTKARSYSTNKDFDQFDLEFWRWDATIKQGFAKNWSAFVNLNNFNNQQDVSFTRNENFLNTTQSFGFTATAGVQYQVRN